MKPYYDHAGITIYNADCREVLGETWGAAECVIVDPPWDKLEMLDWVVSTVSSEYESLLVFTDSRRVSDPIMAFGAPAWIFIWDTMNTWSVSPRQPVQQAKLALWYGRQYDRDGELWGEAPPRRDHPTTKQTPLNGRRLTDIYRQSIRWLHNPTAGAGSAGTERFTTRQGDPALRHAKPVGWLRCLIGNTSSEADVIDPFMGTGTTLRAAKDLGRTAVGVEIEERYCEMAARRMEQEVLPLGGDAA